MDQAESATAAGSARPSNGKNGRFRRKAYPPASDRPNPEAIERCAASLTNSFARSSQVNGWVSTANSNAGSSGYQTLLSAYNSGAPINGYPVTPGLLAACEQFGASVCNHNVPSLQSSGNCGSYTDGTGHTGGQTICSWGHVADQQAANQNCQMNGQNKGGTNCPDNGATPGGAISPSPTDAPLSLPDNVG